MMHWMKYTNSNEWLCHKCGSDLHETVEVAFEVSTTDEPKAIPSDQTFIILSLYTPLQGGYRLDDHHDSLVLVLGDKPCWQMPVKMIHGERLDMFRPIIVPPRRNIELRAFTCSGIGEPTWRSSRRYFAFLCGLIRRDVG